MTDWQQHSTPPPLEHGQIHVWLCPLLQENELIADFLATLSTDERERSERFRFDRHRHQYIVGRGLLRYLLSRYLDTNPAAFAFVYSEYDKPSLHQPGANPFHFNLSHSHEYALLGFSSDYEVGIDLEHHRPGFATEEIAQRFFAASEIEALNALPESEQVSAFFRCWTRKEAFLKATGDGLTRELDSFEVSLSPNEGPKLLWLRDGSEPQAWQIVDVPMPANDYSAALVYRGLELTCRFFLWVPE